MKPQSKILIIAGSDSSGGAGIQADIKTVTALGSYAMTAVTAVTSQNTTGVKSVVPIKPEEIEKQIEFSCIDIKPDAVKRNLVGEILSRFEKKGFTISKLKALNFTVEMAEQFYSDHSSKPFFGELVSFITSRKVVAAVIEGEDVINTTREIIGKTNPKEATPGTIRGDFGISITENSIHASDSSESFDKEVNVVF